MNMSEDEICTMDRLMQLDVDPGKIHAQTNMVRLSNEAAVKLAVLNAVSMGDTSKRSLTSESIESFYDQYFESCEMNDPLRDLESDQESEQRRKSLKEFM